MSQRVVLNQLMEEEGLLSQSLSQAQAGEGELELQVVEACARE